MNHLVSFKIVMLLTNIGLRDSTPLGDDQIINDDGSTPLRFLTQIEMNHALTVLYVLVEAARRQDGHEEAPKIGQAFGMIVISGFPENADQPIR